MQKYLVAAALAVTSWGAMANTTFDFDVAGTVTFIANGPGPAPIYTTDPFSGIAVLVVSGDGSDGTYTFNPIQAPDNSLVSFDISTTQPVGIDTDYVRNGSLTAIVQNGAVTSITGSAVESGLDYNCGGYGSACFTFNGLQFSETQNSGPTGYGAFMAGGTLTPIPEPSTWALMAGGLSIVLMRRRAR